MGSTFNPQILVDKLSKLNNSQASIETLSHWCIFHMNKAKQVVETWDRQFHCSARDRRLAFLYLANDILQNSRRKGAEFVGEFWKVLPDALRDVIDNGDEFGKNAALRLIGIWEDRKVFGSRGQILKEELVGRHLENNNKNGKPLGAKMKQPAGNIVDKLVSGYQVVYGGQMDEDVLLTKCRNAISCIEKLDKEISSGNSGKFIMENEFDLSETPLVGDGNRSGSGNQCSQGVDNSSMQASCKEHSLGNSNQGDNVETISATSTENADVGDNTKAKSVVWNHFKKVIINEQQKAICNYCEKKLGAASKNGTKHLHEHFKRCPRRKVRDIRQHVLVKKQNKVDGKVLLSNYHFDEDVSRNELSRMIILHEYPLSMVEHHGFRKYSTSLQPLFKVPSRNTIKNEILKIYEYEREKTLHLLEKNEGRIAITTDMWTSSNQKKGFMAITTHFIDNHWNMQSRIMRFIYVPCPHTADILSISYYKVHDIKYVDKV